MNLMPVSRFAKRLLSPNAYDTLKKYYELGSPRRLFMFLPYGLFPKYQYPSMLRITLTTKCNLRCFICTREGFIGQDLKFENIFKLKKAIKYAHSISLTGFGEPLMYPGFEDVLNYIYLLNPRKNLIQITTNGTRLSEHVANLLRGHLRSLTISLNAASADTYNNEMKNGSFETTITAIHSFLTELNTDRNKVGLHFVAHAENFHEIPDFVILANNLGISTVTIGHYRITDVEHSKYILLHIKEEYNAILDKAQNLGKRLGVVVDARRRFFSENKRSVRECLSPFNECHIQITGDVSPCCFCGGYSFGNVYESNFEKIWFGDEYRKLRKERYLPACRKCVAFIPLDDLKAHFTPRFKEKRSSKTET